MLRWWVVVVILYWCPFKTTESRTLNYCLTHYHWFELIHGLLPFLIFCCLIWETQWMAVRHWIKSYFLVYLDLFVGVFIIQIYHSKGIQTTSHLCMGLYKMKRWIKRLLNQVKYEFECGEAGYVHCKRNSEERLQF